MKNLRLLFVLLFLISFSTYAQRVTVYPKNSYVKENLDLNAVAMIYEQSANLQDFQQKLNYPKDRISNLDLNNDNKVDYLRVSEKIVNNIKIILIQAEVDSNIFEDVASINIVLKSNNALVQSNNTISQPNDAPVNQRATYTTDSGIRPRDIIVPFLFTAMELILLRHR